MVRTATNNIPTLPPNLKIINPYSDTQIEFMKNETCKTVCTKSYDPKKSEDSGHLKELKRAMNLNYYHHWIVGGSWGNLCVNEDFSAPSPPVILRGGSVFFFCPSGIIDLVLSFIF